MTTLNLTQADAVLLVSTEHGGQVGLTHAGRDVLTRGAPLTLVIDGVPISRWTGSVDVHEDASGVTLTGKVTTGVEAALRIRPIGNLGAFEFRVTLKAIGGVPARIARADSFAADLAGGDWRGLSYTSKWGEEFEPDPFVLTGPVELEVRTGRSALGRDPWLGLEAPNGHALVVTPSWSGNWHIGIEAGPSGYRIASGISPWKFYHDLAPGTSFEAPAVLIAAGASQDLASLALTRGVASLIPRSAASEAIPVEWNHWWPYEDKEIDEATFLANVEIGAALGFEVSTLDAGWFGVSDSDTFWWDIRGDFAEENRARFPRGLQVLADETRVRGQKFGIWMEIEAVGLKARLRRERPEIMARRDDDPPEAPLDAGEPGFLGYVCLGSDAGRDHVAKGLEALHDKTRFEWIKVDFNLDPKAGCTCPDHDHGAGDGLYAHYRGLYALLDEFRHKHPDVIVEACASGGLRLDTGLVQHVHCAFLSDPDWPTHHFEVLHGVSRMLPAASVLHWPFSEWRTNNPNQTFRVTDPELTDDRFDAVVRGGFPHRFGLSWRLPSLTVHQQDRLKRHIRLYKDVVRAFVRAGDLQRLTGTPLRSGGGERAPGFQLSLNDRHLLFGFALPGADASFSLKPVGLLPDRMYRLTNLSFEASGEVPARLGWEWLSGGIGDIETPSYIGVLEPV